MFFNDGIMELLSRNETWMAGKCPKHVLFFVRFLNGEDHRTKMRLLFFRCHVCLPKVLIVNTRVK